MGFYDLKKQRYNIQWNPLQGAYYAIMARGSKYCDSYDSFT